jgi:hypothetical protein
MLTVFTAKYTSKHASGGQNNEMFASEASKVRVKLYYFLFGRTLLTRYKLKYQNIRWKSEETSFTKVFSKNWLNSIHCRNRERGEL